MATPPSSTSNGDNGSSGDNGSGLGDACDDIANGEMMPRTGLVAPLNGLVQALRSGVVNKLRL